MQPYIDLLTQNGYVPADQKKDFGAEISYVRYLLRKRGTIHEYVSLVSYDGKFCEAVYELYAAEKNVGRAKGNNNLDKAKRGYDLLLASLPRSMEDLTKYVTKTDAEISEQVKTLLEKLEKAQKANK